MDDAPRAPLRDRRDLGCVINGSANSERSLGKRVTQRCAVKQLADDVGRAIMRTRSWTARIFG